MHDWKLVGRWWHGPKGRKVRAISGAGGGSNPKVKGPTETTVVQSGDPSLADMNKYVTGELKATLPKYGGLEGLIEPKDYMFTDSGKAGGPEAAALGSLKGFYTGPQENPYELSGLQSMQNASDPDRQLAAGADYLDRIASPELKNYYTSIGQGRSGAIGEGIANAGAKMALPILQQSQQNQMQLGGAQMNYGQLQRSRELQSLGALYNMAAMPRMEQASAEQSARDTLLATMLRFPVASGAGSSTTKQFIPDVQGGEPPIWQQVMGGVNSVMGIASMAMMCWVAAALWAETDWNRFLCAWFQMNFGKPSLLGRLGRKLYRRYGRRWAESSTMQTILRPFLERAAQAGARELGVIL